MRHMHSVHPYTATPLPIGYMLAYNTYLLLLLAYTVAHTVAVVFGSAACAMAATATLA